MTALHEGYDYIIRVEKVLAGSPLTPGLLSPTLLGQARVGRLAEAEVHLPDPTISGTHLIVWLDEAGFHLRNESRHGTTLVQGAPLAYGQTQTLDAEAVWVQVGRALLHIYRAPRTIPVGEMIELPRQAQLAPEVPLLRFQSFAGRVELWVRGHAVHVFPTVARLLVRLAQTPGEVVTHGELEMAVSADAFPKLGGSSIAQLVTYARQMFSDALDAGWIDEDELRDLVAPCAHGDEQELAALDRQRLLQLLIQNIRGLGYRLHLPPHQIVFTG